ncbi:sensor histidine kinase [Leifsonella bigeumensis]|uniref:sensor histidine kinase n=1 Tax=Leifsonella bigeumensis TaxID=433643 RepID=UPI0031DD1729
MITTSRPPETYGRRWRTVPRELCFHAPTIVVVAMAFIVLSTLFSTATSLIAIVVGIFVLTVTMWVARYFGELELTRLDWAGMPAIARPRWQQPGPGFWSRFLTPLADPHAWVYFIHGTVVNFVVGIVTWSVVLTWVAGSLGGLTYWFWSAFVPQDDFYLSEVIVSFFTAGTVTVDGRAAESIMNLLFGIVFLVTLPYVTRGLARLHHVIARAMLGAWRSEELAERVGELSASRGAAAAAEGHSLRRLERDIHDGPQQRLVRLQMDLAAAERKLATDPDAARALIEEARVRSQEALDELRALSRGFAPPILLDRGLVAALESLASRSTIPVRVSSALDPAVDLPQEIERNAYFVASELVANAVKHSGAGTVQVVVALRRLPEQDEWWLDVAVTDDGHGGATSVDGHGLAGLEERLRGLGGTLELDSPTGGPTVATGHLPVTY